MALAERDQDPAQMVPPPLRADLIIREQFYLGRSYQVLKAPLSLSYFRLPSAQALAAAAFNGRKNLGTLVSELREKSPYWKGLPREDGVLELQALSLQLGNSGLLRVAAHGATERSRRMREAKKSHLFESTMGHILYFKKAIYDPDTFLERALPKVQWIYSWPVLAATVLFMMTTLVVALGRWDEIIAHGANFFTLQNLGLTWVLFLGVKVVHEFGHAFTCKKYGGEVHEMGFMFILFTPYLFCNVSDSWLASKWERVAVTAAGIAVELVLASIATWLWLLSQPGLFHQMCFNTMVLCSVSTVLFNGNPLMKFDGYYIMSDLLEVPNLRAKSNAWVTRWAQRYLLGLKELSQRVIGGESGYAFGLYAVASYCYGWFILYRISIHMFNMLEPYGLQFVSRTYVGLFLFVSFGLPLIRLGRSLKFSSEFRTAGMSRFRWLVMALLAAGSILFFIPMEDSVVRSAAREASEIAPISSPSPGYLREIYVKEGDMVQAGEVLGLLENREIETQRSELRSQRESALVRQRASMADASVEARLSVPILKNFVQEADEQIRALEDRLARLQLRSPVAGTVRTKQLVEKIGLRFAADQPILEVGAGASGKVIIALNEKEARKVVVGQVVAVRFYGLPDRVFHGRITAVPSASSPGFSIPAFANIFGGDVPAKLNADHHPTPSLPHYEAEAVIDLPPEDALLLRSQSTGKARISTKDTSVALWLRDRILDVIDPNVRL